MQTAGCSASVLVSIYTLDDPSNRKCNQSTVVPFPLSKSRESLVITTAMEDSLHIVLFGDQTGDCRSIFRQVLHIKDNTFLTSFFEKAYSALRDEVAQQPRAVRDQVSGFTSITDLVARYSDSTDAKSNPLESALTCISQIACFIWYVIQFGVLG